MASLVVFDLDGTLIDSRQDLAESTNEMLATYGAAPLAIDHVVKLVGEGARVLVERALETAGLDPGEPDALSRFREVYDRRLLIHTRPYDGIPEVVDRFAGRASLAVLTNKPEAPSRRLLEAFNLASKFNWVIGGDSDFARKPDPAGLLHVMDRAGATGRTTLMIGDSMIDVETGRRAGARICVALYGFGHLRGGLTLTASEWTVDDPGDLEAVIGAFL